MHIESVEVGEFQVNCLIGWTDPGRAFVVDPGADSDRIRKHLEARGLTVGAYLLTHGHMDHVSAVASLYEVAPADVYLHPADEAWAFSEANEWLPFYPRPERPGGPVLAPDLLREGKQAGWGWQVIPTPGHTPGSVCYYLPGAKVLFSGDTLFADSVGRTDLPGGSSRQLQMSLRLLAALPDDVVVYAGHGPETTIGAEKSGNFFMRASVGARGES